MKELTLKIYVNKITNFMFYIKNIKNDNMKKFILNNICLIFLINNLTKKN